MKNHMHDHPERPFMDPEYDRRITKQRQQREEFFASDPHSPIPPEQQESFPGLAYFPIDPDFRFERQLHEHDEVETLTVETSTGGQREYLRWGRFDFDLDGEGHSLHAYKADPEEDRLWVPFRDETNGEETYGAGRYLDLEPDAHRTTEGSWILDFNEAYNPTCAYNEAYECPLIPMENWLEVRIQAGEQQYPANRWTTWPTIMADRGPPQRSGAPAGP